MDGKDEEQKEELNLTFTSKIWGTGGSNVITLPINYIKEGYFDKGDPITVKVIGGIRHPKKK